MTDPRHFFPLRREGVDMLKEFSSRMSRTLGVFALSAALGLAGCADPGSSDVRVTERSANPAQIAQAISNDQDFLTLIDVSTALAGELMQAQRAQTPDVIDAVARTITHPDYAATTDPASLVTNLGGDAEHLDTMRSLMAELVQRYGLQNASEAQIQTIFFEAVNLGAAKSHLDGAIEYELHALNENADLTTDECEALCDAEYLAAAALAMSAYVAVLIGAVALGPAGVIGVVVAFAEFNHAMAVAQSQHNRCRDECNGIFSEECGWDHDCATDEFCWKGVLGIGKNECRDKKAEGKVCARDGQCESDCCKYHLWSNPVSQVCRPSDKCN